MLGYQKVNKGESLGESLGDPMRIINVNLSKLLQLIKCFFLYRMGSVSYLVLVNSQLEELKRRPCGSRGRRGNHEGAGALAAGVVLTAVKLLR